MKIMKTYRWVSDGFTFKASSAKEACTILWNSMKFRWDRTLQEWINSTAHFWSSHCVLRTDSPEHLFQDLIKNNIVEEISSDESIKN